VRTEQVWAIAFVVVSAIAYGELVHDWRTPRSDRTARFIVSANHVMSVPRFHQIAAEMEKKYGERVKNTLLVDTGIVQVKLDGRVIETHELKKALGSVLGLFVVGAKGTAKTRFPFEFSADQTPGQFNRPAADVFSTRFKGSPKEWFEFKDSDWTIDRCAALPPGLGLGCIGETLQLREGMSCVVTWKGLPSGSMLISVSRADGDPWMRPFVRRLCRAITDAALKRFAPEQPDRPNYAGCVLADRPEYASAQRSLAVDMYSVGPADKLARMD
jgi:hypothetical protein